MSNLLKDAREAIVGALVGAGIGASELRRVTEDLEQEMVRSRWTESQREEFGRMSDEMGFGRTKEGLADLELAFEDIGWRDLTTYFGIWKFNRATMRRVVALSRIMYIINPLIKRAVTVQELYVWGSGCTIKAHDKRVQVVLDDFFTDPKNQKVVGQGEEGWTQREREQRVDGNQFFAFFTNRATGAVRVRLLPYDLVEDVIYNPRDNKEVWFYRRSTANLAGAAMDTDMSGAVSTIPNSEGLQILYPDVGYQPAIKSRTFGDSRLPIDWNVRILHVKTGGLSSMKFGLPELYGGLNWATAYKKILENFATILGAYARLAMKMTGLPGKKGIAAAKSKLNTAVTSGNLRDSNPPSNTASWMMMSGNVDVSPIKTAHSTTAPDEARALRCMVASAADLPEHFFGDSEVGNMATSETLDRPTELKMIARQNMWRQVILQMCRIVIESSVLAAKGKLRASRFDGQVEVDPFDSSMRRTTIEAPADGTLHIDVVFPNITERATTERVRAVVNAATLNGRKAEGIIPDRKYLCKLLLESLGIQDADEMAEKLYPGEVGQGFIDPALVLKNETTEADAKMLLAEAQVKAAENPAPAPKPAAKPAQV